LIAHRHNQTHNRNAVELAILFTEILRFMVVETNSWSSKSISPDFFADLFFPFFQSSQIIFNTGINFLPMSIHSLSKGVVDVGKIRAKFIHSRNRAFFEQLFRRAFSSSCRGGKLWIWIWIILRWCLGLGKYRNLEGFRFEKKEETGRNFFYCFTFCGIEIAFEQKIKKSKMIRIICDIMWWNKKCEEEEKSRGKPLRKIHKKKDNIEIIKWTVNGEPQTFT